MPNEDADVKKEGVQIDNLNDEQLAEALDQNLDDAPEEEETPAESSTEKKPEEDKPDDAPTGEDAKPDEDKSDEEEQEGKEDPKKKGGEGKEDDDDAGDDTGDDDVKDPDENVPFHKHPRFKAIIKKNKEMGVSLEKTQKALDDATAFIEGLKTGGAPKAETEDKGTPKWFTTLYGEGPEIDEAWTLYRADLDQRLQANQQSVEDKIAQAQADQTEAEKAAGEWVQTQLDNLRDDGKEFDEAELKAVAVKYRPTDAEGNLDFGKAYEIMEGLRNKPAAKKPATEAKKKIADATMTDKPGAVDQQPVMSSKNLRNKTMDSLAHEDD